jgi:hypothetical protein
MKNTKQADTKKKPAIKTMVAAPGFAIEIKPDTELGLAMLIAEDEEGNHEPVAVTNSINDAKDIAADDMCQRMRRLESGDDPGICPCVYKLWARGIDGDYRVASSVAPW